MEVDTKIDKLAIDGGNRIRTNPFPVGNRFENDELEMLKTSLEQNTLFYFKGEMTKKFLKSFCININCRHAVATSSGTAAIHTALGAIGVGLGDEVITTSITDMGTVIGILYQNAVPIFCDNLPNTYGMDPVDLEKKITPKTKAIITVHLAGNPCDMYAIMKIANKYNIPVIEDCAQSWGCRYDGKHVGTFGSAGCFSTNDFKHLSTGDGGIACSNSEELYYKMHLFADKGYDRFGGGRIEPKVLSPNYRWSELQAAVALAQIGKLKKITETRQKFGDLLTSMIEGLDTVKPPKITDKGESSYWFYMFRLELEQLNCSRDYFAECLRAEGIPAAGGYIKMPIYKYPLFRDEHFFNNGWPVKMLGLTNIDYKNVYCPAAEDILKSAVFIPFNEFYTEYEVEDIASSIRKVSKALSR